MRPCLKNSGLESVDGVPSEREQLFTPVLPQPISEKFISDKKVNHGTCYGHWSSWTICVCTTNKVV